MKALESIGKEALIFFGSKKKIKEFLELVSTCGSVALSSSKLKLSPLRVSEIIGNDKKLMELINQSLKLAIEIAEGVLYERAVNGYTEETIIDGVKTGEKKKYSDSCLLSYLRANSCKYSSSSSSSTSKTASYLEPAADTEIPTFKETEDNTN